MTNTFRPALGRRHAFDAGNPVVHGDQQLRLACEGDLDDFRRQAVAIFETIGHQVIDMGRAQQAQAQHANRTGRRTIGIEITDDQNALTLFQRRHQQVHRGVDSLELLIGNQASQAFIQLNRRLHASGGVQAGQQRRQVTEERQGVG